MDDVQNGSHARMKVAFHDGCAIKRLPGIRSGLRNANLKRPNSRINAKADHPMWPSSTKPGKGPVFEEALCEIAELMPQGLLRVGSG